MAGSDSAVAQPTASGLADARNWRFLQGFLNAAHQARYPRSCAALVADSCEQSTQYRVTTQRSGAKGPYGRDSRFAGRQRKRGQPALRTNHRQRASGRLSVGSARHVATDAEGRDRNDGGGRAGAGTRARQSARTADEGRLPRNARQGAIRPYFLQCGSHASSADAEPACIDHAGGEPCR